LAQTQSTITRYTGVDAYRRTITSFSSSLCGSGVCRCNAASVPISATVNSSAVVVLQTLCIH